MCAPLPDLSAKGRACPPNFPSPSMASRAGSRRAAPSPISSAASNSIRGRSRSSATARSRRARRWPKSLLGDGDVLEIVHFVGGGRTTPGRHLDRGRPHLPLAADRRHRQVQGFRRERRGGRGIGRGDRHGRGAPGQHLRPQGADADRFHRSRKRSPTCPTPPAASPPTRRSARCGWRARRAAGIWSSSKCWARRARSIPTCARR